MGKKKLRAKYTAKGERTSNKKIRNMVRADRTPADILIAKLEAFKKGKTVYFTIDNPNPNETAKRKIRVAGNLIYGDFREFGKPPKKRVETEATG